jgi:hypothetical protein
MIRFVWTTTLIIADRLRAQFRMLTWTGRGANAITSRNHLILRTEPAGNNVKDYGVNKAAENLPVLRKTFSAINDNCLDVQQEFLETFVDRGQLRKLAEPTITSTGKRIPGLKLDHPRQLALTHALVRFAHIAAGSNFTTAEIHPAVIARETLRSAISLCTENRPPLRRSAVLHRRLVGRGALVFWDQLNDATCNPAHCKDRLN